MELQATVPTFNIPFVPIIQKGQKPFSMFNDLQSSFGSDTDGRLLRLLEYASAVALVRGVKKFIVNPALARSKKLSWKKSMPVRVRKLS